MRTWEFKRKKCHRCFRVYMPTSPCQKYCGSRKKRVGCSYLAHLKEMAVWGKSHLEYFREYGKKYRPILKKRHPNYYRDYYRKHKKTK